MTALGTFVEPSKVELVQGGGIPSVNRAEHRTAKAESVTETGYAINGMYFRFSDEVSIG